MGEGREFLQKKLFDLVSYTTSKLTFYEKKLKVLQHNLRIDREVILLYLKLLTAKYSKVPKTR
jgi:hypothetical protein